MVLCYANGASQCSPVQKDLSRVVKHDEDGNEFIVWQEVDYPAIQNGNGTVDQWSLDALLKAGINPRFNIHTGLSTRLEGVGIVQNAAAVAEQIFAESENDNNK